MKGETMEWILSPKNKVILRTIKVLFNSIKGTKSSSESQFIDGSLSKHMQKDLGIESEHTNNDEYIATKDYTKYL
ncbi:hypothetical protein [Vibrio sp. 10N.261.55.A7]|uniref:hypothetical protein n=2 Tax=Vibrio TaxID=662 RepID=UPI000C822A46|nr:hypothetical protein [Vibrio sp. 10N.261.55.A7]PMJ91491.1 hypothetical protein BCU12_09815 [Vibrio sp. 10N.261.55.A7]